MAVLAVTSIGPAGVASALVAGASGGDRAPVGERNFLHVKNTSGSALTVTVDSVAPCSYGVDHDLVVSVPATTGERYIGPLSPSRYAAVSDGMAAVTYSANPPTGLTIGVVQL